MPTTDLDSSPARPASSSARASARATAQADRRRAIILAAGEIDDLERLTRQVLEPAAVSGPGQNGPSGDLLIAVDGGLRHWRRLGLAPWAWVGDGDSVNPDDRAWAEAAGTRFHWHPRAKDQSDLELALRLAQSEGASDIRIWGALGGRWDMTLANLLLAAHPDFIAADLQISLHDGPQSLSLIHDQAEVNGLPGDTVSLIALGADVHGVTTVGLEYPLAEGTIRFGSTLGVSNVLTHPTARIRVASALLMCAVIAQPGEQPLEERMERGRR